jgi:hypothetical protein
MDKDNCLVKVEGEDGKVFDMLILKEFDYKNKKYAVLSEIDACGCHHKCECDDDCDCGCNEGEECTCEDECDCGCEGHCHSDEEPLLCLLEITKDKGGNEIFKSIDDEKLFNELVEEADKILYED